MKCVLSALVLLLAAALDGALGLDLRERDEEKLIGWQGEKPYQPEPAKEKNTWVQVIAWKPRAFIFHNFISEAEASHIVDLAWPQMQRSTVVGPNGTSVLDDYRTSYGTFLARYQTPVLARIQDRVALFTRTPMIHQEDMQVLRYGIGQYYHKHTDSLENDSPRMATVLIYLADPEEGGETAFPDGSEWANPEMEAVYGPQLSECAKGSVAFRPRRGDALMFFSIHPDGKTEDMRSMHEGCPVVRGAKWTTTIWVHTVPFRGYEMVNGRFQRGDSGFVDPGVCRNSNERCDEWAAAGECDKNPVFMKGTPEQMGVCLSSCGVCEPCSEDDRVAKAPCYWRNRQKLNYLTLKPEELQFRRSADDQ